MKLSDHLSKPKLQLIANSRPLLAQSKDPLHDLSHSQRMKQALAALIKNLLLFLDKLNRADLN